MSTSTSLPVAVISCSLAAESNSRILAEQAHALLSAEGGVTSDLIDLRDQTLPLCDGDNCYHVPAVNLMTDRLRAMRAIILAAPVYNYDVNAVAKNLVELTGPAWEDKVVAFLCAAGGQSSYMSVMGLANSLMLDFRCVIVPRFVYVTGKSFDNGKVSDPEIVQRIEQLVRATIKLVV